MTITIPGKLLQDVECKTAGAHVAVHDGAAGNIALDIDGLVVAFYGGADLHEGNPIWTEILALSKGIAGRGGIMVNGGGKGGAMLATAQAFPDHTVGILSPGIVGNPYGAKVSVESRLTRDDLLAKMPIMVVFEGGVGTIAEWARALKEIKVSQSESTTPPRVFIHHYWRKTFDELWACRALPKRIMDHVQFFVTADEVMSAL